ncbi:hypothetical protein KP509_21G077200 [Ceratopteris richardii]|uniref:SAM domain-containing protein n=1 Tax=Ceratopteris richardii TaxID=49495 RepID=A0A8T2SBJ4_CERRI|nr:hypothetical protein KP509_21G077200 [Ceratopteris richardii]KAH7316069.1 hypothetical protein KP509_21G077200 [Ceratopteris richardii]
MWNRAATETWKEVDQGAIVDKSAVVTSLGVEDNKLGTKRQRRPSVRLEDIGNRPAAIVAGKKKKKIVLFGSSLDVFPENNTVRRGNQTQENVSKFSKVKSSVHVHKGSSHDPASSHDGNDSGKQIIKHDEATFPSSSAPVERWRQQPYARLPDSSARAVLLQPSNHFDKKGRYRSHKLGQSNLATSAKVSVIEGGIVSAEGSPHFLNSKDADSDEENDACTPEGFRDCDLDASDCCNDIHFEHVKGLNISRGSKCLRNGDNVLLRDEQECQSVEVYQDESDHEIAERDKGLHGSQQSHNESSWEKNKDSVRPSKSKAGVSVWAGATVELASLRRAKPTFETVECQNSRELVANDTELHSSRPYPVLINGVKGWLESLGLDKYAQQFEDHEVDVEVLPLLTLDDLKEMGITAVGSRRKLFFAIQQLLKCSLVKAAD